MAGMDIDRIIRTCENNPATAERKMILGLARQVQDLQAQLNQKSGGKSGGQSGGGQKQGSGQKSGGKQSGGEE